MVFDIYFFIFKYKDRDILDFLWEKGREEVPLNYKSIDGFIN